MNPLPKSVWERCRFSEDQADEVPNFRNWLRESETDLGIYLADAELPPGALKPEFEVIDVREIESLIARSCDPKTDYLFYGRLLKLVIRELTRSGVLIPSPKLLESLRREKHPCPDNFVPYHLQVKEWSKAACGWISCFAEGKGNIPVGLVALCSILWGRALHPETVLAIVGACSSTKKRFRYSSAKMIYTDLSLPWNNLQHQEIQRWYADGPLACLIARIGEQDREDPPADPKDTKAYSAWKARVTKTLFDEIQHGLLENGVKEPPRDLAAIIKAVDLTLVSYVPPLFRKFWTREIHPRSLWPSSIARIYGEESLASEIIKQIEQTAPDEIELDEDILEEAEKEESQNAENPQEPPEWLTELLGYLITGDPHQSVQLLRPCIGRFRAAAPIAGELAEFALRLLEKGAFTTGTRWLVPTIRSCVRSVAMRLGQLVGDMDLTQDAVSLASFYQQAIDLVTEGKDPNRLRESVMMAIREFHRFMVNRYPRLSLNESEIFRSYRGLFSVDARILSIDDVLQVLEFLDTRSTLAKNEVERKAAKFLVVLAFSIGSRRMENFWLREIDFPSSKTLSVIFRPWGNHRLKTLNATRVGHFKAFHMPPLFEQVVVDWYELFNRQAGKNKHHKKEKGDKFLLRGSETAEQSIPVHVLIPIVHEAMQEVTGDSTVHLHLLRHSCASWTFVRLILSDFEKIPDLFAHLPETNRWIKESSKPFRLALYQNENVTNDHGWAISTLLGQSRPDVPMDNYVHTVDRLSALVLSESGYLDEVYGDTLLRDASGLTFGTFYNRLKEHKSPVEIVEEVVTSRIPKATIQPARTLRQNWAFSTHELMRLALTSGQPVYDLAPALNMERETAERVLRRMDELLGTGEKSVDQIPERPHKSNDPIISDLASMIEKEVEREAQGKTKQRLAELLDAFEKVKRPIPEFAIFTPITSVSAIKYMDCLAVVDVQRGDLKFVLWGVKEGSNEDKALQKIGGRHPYEYLPGQQRGALRGPCLTIGPRFDPMSPKPALRSESALRFVLEMASFRF